MSVEQQIFSKQLLVLLSAVAGYIPLAALYTKNGGTKQLAWLLSIHTLLVGGVVLTLGGLSAGALHIGQRFGVMGGGLLLLAFTYRGKQHIAELEQAVREQGAVIISDH